jgi:hypothetical protein
MNPTATTSSTITVDGEVLDPRILKVMGAIRALESGSGDYNAIGDGGAARGAFQYNEKTGPGWKNIARQYLGDENAVMDRANQNKATYYRIKDWQQNGYNGKPVDPVEIAALWNGASKDASGRYVCNKPEYCRRFIEILYGVSQPAQQNPNEVIPDLAPKPVVPAPVLPAATTTPKEETEKEKSFGRKALEFIAPVLEEKERTPLQWAGDIGLTALNVVPAAGIAKLGIGGLKTVANILKGTNALSKTEKAAEAAAGATKGVLSKKNIGIGLGTGYGMDVAGSLAEGETSTKDIFTPGIGTLLGGVGGSLLRTPARAQVEKAAQDLILDLPYGKSVAQTGRLGQVKSGISGTISQPITPDVYRTTETVLRNVPGYTRMGTYTEKLNAVNAARTRLAEDLSKQVVENGDDIIYPYRELAKKMASLEPSIPIRADSTQLRQYQLAQKAALQIAQKHGGKISGLFRARKEFDELIEKEFPTLYDRTNAPMRAAITDMRRVMNETIEKSLQGKGVNYSQSLKEQNELFKARDALASKAYEELGTNRFDRFMKNNPVVTGILKNILPVGVAGGVGAGVTNWLLKD